MLLPLIITGFILWVWFTAYTLRTLQGIPYCISDTYYVLDRKGWYFIAVLFFQAVLLCCPILGVACEVGKLVVWIAGGLELLGILTVSFSPEFKTNRTQYLCHFTGSIIGMMGSQVFVFFVCPWAFFGWLIPLGWKLGTLIHHHSESCKKWDLEILDSGDWLWWFEMGMFLTTYISLFVAIL